MNVSMNGLKRTHRCGVLRGEDIGKEVVLCGWVSRRRDLGKLVFVTLRDVSGIVQCAFDETKNAELFEKALALRSEYTICVSGVVASRGEGAINPNMPTGEIEIIVDTLTVFSRAQITPFEITDNITVNEALRLKYRYLDLRRPSLQSYILKRHELAQITRKYFCDEEFYEIETPILTKSTPEGARDYLVPSRVHAGKFYALPQSPQQYKQLLMVAGFDRYFQVTRCLRDEDLRIDRQPEFTQVDIEMSFADADDVMDVAERYMAKLYEKTQGKTIDLPLSRITFAEAMERFGSDKPDMRFGYELKDIGDAVTGCGFSVFENALAQGGSVRAICVPGGAKYSRREIDKLTEFVKTYRAGGLAWMKIVDGEFTSSFTKLVSSETLAQIAASTKAQEGDLCLIVADKDNEIVFAALGALRGECARRDDAIPNDAISLLWVTDFPMYEYNEEDGRFYARHHPFTSPVPEDIPLLESEPEKVRAIAYDMVLNGFELGGGSVRIHDEELQRRVFASLDIGDEEAKNRFGHILEAFRYGAPPHAGIAFGFDRIVMLLSGCESIRDTIAFPKAQNASEIMMGSPDYVDEKQLKELHITLDIVDEEKLSTSDRQ